MTTQVGLALVIITDDQALLAVYDGLDDDGKPMFEEPVVVDR